MSALSWPGFRLYGGPMNQIISRLQEEHRNLEKLVGLLDRFSTRQNSPGFGDIALLVDTFSYLTCFPDVRHHPVEDRIVDRMHARNLLSPGLKEEIERQHRVLAKQGADLMRDLESAAREESTTWPAVALSARLYAERLRHNMAVEEMALFPLAETGLSMEDWDGISELFVQEPVDPLFVSQTEKRFSDLRKVIAEEAGCDCFAKPATRGSSVKS